jgi:murein L,D-transpeptidase YcbB/YkuD
MNRISFTVVTVIIILLLMWIGWYAFITLKMPASDAPSEKIGDIYTVATDPVGQGDVAPVSEAPSSSDTATSVADSTPDSLQDRLQKLLDAKTTLKIGSKGPAVGTIQEFMNLYFKKTLKVDNDFGKTLEANVKAFQKANGITQTGQVGTQGLTKMIEWVKKQ